MTIDEMHKAVLQRIDAMQQEVDVPSEDVERALNKAIDRFVKERFQKEGNPLREGFEMSQVRIDDLRELITESGGLTTQEVAANFSDNIFIDSVDLPADYRYLIKVSAKVQYNKNGVTYTLSNSQRVPDGALGTDYAEKTVNCKYMQLDDISATTSDPFNKPRIENPKYTVNDNSIYVYTDDTFIVDEVYVTYLKEPATVDLVTSTDCDLATSTHEDIVEIASNLLLESKSLNQQQVKQT